MVERKEKEKRKGGRERMQKGKIMQEDKGCLVDKGKKKERKEEEGVKGKCAMLIISGEGKRKQRKKRT